MTKAPLSFAGNHHFTSAVVTLLRLSTLLIKFILNLFIAKYLGFDVLGIFGLISASCIVLPIIFSLGLNGSLSRKAITQNIQSTIGDIKNYFRYLSIIYLFVCIATLAWCIHSETWISPWLVIAILILEHLNGDSYNLLLNLSRPITANVLHFIRAALWPLLYMAAAYHDESLRNIDILLSFWISGLVLSTFGLLIATQDWPWRCKRNERFTSWIRHETSRSRSLYLNGLADTTGTHADRYIITLILGLDMTGVYVFYAQIVSAISNLLHTGVIQFSRPKLVRYHHEQSPKYFPTYRKCLRDTFIASSLISASAAIVTYFALPILKLDLAFQWHPVFLLILAGFIVFILTQVGDLVLYSQHKDNLTLKLSLFYFSSKLFCCAALLPHLGLWGAGLAAIISSTVKMAVQKRVLGKSIFR